MYISFRGCTYFSQANKMKCLININEDKVLKSLPSDYENSRGFVHLVGATEYIKELKSIHGIACTYLFRGCIYFSQANKIEMKCSIDINEAKGLKSLQSDYENSRSFVHLVGATKVRKIHE